MLYKVLCVKRNVYLERRELIPLEYIVPEEKRLRVIIDTDAACEADDPYAIAHALMSKKLEVKAIFAEQFGGTETTRKSYDEILTILDVMSLSIPVYREAPIFLEDTSYRFEEGRPKIRVYTSVDSRFILEDFISKLQLLYGIEK